MEDMTFTNNGKTYDIVTYFRNEETKKNYIVYTDESDELYASIYEIINDELVLYPIENDEEWEYIDSMLVSEDE